MSATVAGAGPAVWIAAVYAALNVGALLAYAWDKRAARRGGGRIRERTLHLWALAGGFVGAWLGQAWLRHKTQHPAFAVIAVLAAATHAAGWAWFCL